MNPFRISLLPRALFLAALAGMLAASLSGCGVPTKQHDQVLAEKKATETELAQVTEERDRLKIRLRRSAMEKSDLLYEVKVAQQDIAKQQAVFNSLQNTFAKEMQAKQIKIELMKSGINVNLAQEILFASGSAELNSSGQEVIRKFAKDLKEVPYQTIVGGHTDNVPISGNLLQRFPSNWELAGARAASVVRLLESEGIPAEQLMAISFGESHPVESNETPEGRAQNRRIEIRLRPVATQ